MSNSPLVTYTRLTKNKSTRKNKIDTITIHCYVGQVTAKQGCDYFADTDREVSSNYVVGKDGSIGLSVEEKFRAWTTGGYDSKGNPVRVNGISGADNDHRAVTIEVASGTKEPYEVTDEAYDALIKLVADICKRNNIKEVKWKADAKLVGRPDMQNMTVHRWFANKSCPGEYLYTRMGDIAEKANAILGVTGTPSKPYEHTEPISVGDIVNFTGNTHYVSAVSAYGRACSPGKARVTSVSSTGKHALHIVAIAGGGSNVYGWVDAEYVTRAEQPLAVGMKVRVREGAKSYTGTQLASFVYKNTYDVVSINGDRVVIGIGKAVTAAVHKKNLTLA